MHPILLLWTLGFPVLFHALCAQGENLHAGRQLSITSKECSSPSAQHKGIVGTCMFNLECQKRGGIVIAACIDRFLFGACCFLEDSLSGEDVGTTTLATFSEIGTTPPTATNTRNGFIPESSYPILFQSTSIPPPTLRPFESLRNTIDPDSSSSDKVVYLQHTTDTTPMLGDSGDIPSTDDTFTVLPFPLETFPSSSNNINVHYDGNNNNMHNSDDKYDHVLANTTLTPYLLDILYKRTEPTKESIKFSTFMFVNSYTNSPTTPSSQRYPLSQNSEKEVTESTNRPLFNDSIDQSLESTWPVSTQQDTATKPVQTVFEEKLDSDELFNYFINNVPGSANVVVKQDGNHIDLQTLNKLEESLTPTDSINRIWETTTTSSSNTESTIVEQVNNHQNSFSTTERPWSFSTYQIHTFKYPQKEKTGSVGTTGSPYLDSDNIESTTFNPHGGLVTWGSVETLQRTTTIKPKPTTEFSSAPNVPLAPVRVEDILQTWSDALYSQNQNIESLNVVPVTEAPIPISTTPRIYRRPTFSAPSVVHPVESFILQVNSTISKNATREGQPIFNKLNNELEVNTIDQAITPSNSLHSELEDNLDDFVNQVVQGLAGSLDNLDLDEVILQQAVPASIGNFTLVPPTIHPFQILSDPLSPGIPVNKPGKASLDGTQKINILKMSPTTTTTTTTPQPMDYRKDCGVRTLAKQGRIVGGTTSKFGKWPWQALVRETTWLGLFSKNKCGGVLISPKYVLTAAHCQPGFLATLTVVLGDTDLSSNNDGSNSNSILKTVRRVIVHRDYNAQTFENDIAILELDSAVEYQPHIVPICLPNENEIKVGQYGFVTGWGRLKYGGKVPQVLHEVDVPILNNSDCQNMFLKSGHIKAIRESFICAGYADGAKDSCEGDSGGPLAIQRPNGQWILAGTVSHGIKCAYPNLPGVYMRMTFYKSWIKRVTGLNS